MDHDPAALTPSEDAIAALAASIADIEREVGRVVLGQDEAIRLTLVAILAGGHVLVEGPPGIGKTLLARTLARVLGVRFTRIQFTPDLMPGDITGGNVFDQRASDFVFRAGPVFTQFLLADEINRAPAKTQAALLEAMGDHQVTADGVRRGLPRPFFVMATQNPIESEGTYPLPEAQLDRFLLKILIDHPPEAVEIDLLGRYAAGFDAHDLEAVDLRTVVDADGLEAIRAQIRRVHAAPELLTYIARLVGATRRHPAVYLGASPRASVALLLCAQAMAAAEGRSYLVPDDVKALAPAVLRHRFLLHPDAELDGSTAETVIARILDEVPVPRDRET